MKTISAVLSKEAINMIFVALVESEPDVADSSIADLFTLLSKLNTDILITTVDDLEMSDLPERVASLIDKIGDELDDLDNEELQSVSDDDEEIWSVNDDEEEMWSVNDDDEEIWSV
jgi:hypothetical protein